MRRAAGLLAVFLLGAAQASADTLVLKTGKNMKGKVIEETDSNILFRQEDGLVVEVPRISVTIVDKDVAEGSAPKGTLNVFSESPDKKPYKPLIVGDDASWNSEVKSPVSSEPPKDSGGDSTFEKMTSFVERWMNDHPEIEKKMKELLQKSKSQSEELDKLAAAAKQN